MDLVNHPFEDFCASQELKRENSSTAIKNLGGTDGVRHGTDTVTKPIL